MAASFAFFGPPTTANESSFPRGACSTSPTGGFDSCASPRTASASPSWRDPKRTCASYRWTSQPRRRACSPPTCRPTSSGWPGPRRAARSGSAPGAPPPSATSSPWISSVSSGSCIGRWPPRASSTSPPTGQDPGGGRGEGLFDLRRLGPREHLLGRKDPPPGRVQRSRGRRGRRVRAASREGARGAHQ
jgi:hypothetical protein